MLAVKEFETHFSKVDSYKQEQPIRSIFFLSLHVLSAGTVAYVGPEVLQRGAIAMPADVYSFAMLLMELWTGDVMYKGVNYHQVPAPIQPVSASPLPLLSSPVDICKDHADVCS